MSANVVSIPGGGELGLGVDPRHFFARTLAKLRRHAGGRARRADDSRLPGFVVDEPEKWTSCAHAHRVRPRKRPRQAYPPEFPATESEADADSQRSLAVTLDDGSGLLCGFTFDSEGE
jgi:hypothetical protein